MSSDTDNTAPGEPEFSRYVDIDDIKDNQTITKELTATDEECAALARRFGLKEIKGLKAKVDVENKGDVIYLVQGRVEADIVQSCVVTLDPVDARIEEDFEVFCADADAIPVVSNDMEYDVTGDEDLPEPVVAGKINIGEIAAQFLSLAIDPYPHAEGAEPEEDGTVWREHDENDRPEKPNPFAVLKDLK